MERGENNERLDGLGFLVNDDGLPMGTFFASVILVNEMQS